MPLALPKSVLGGLSAGYLDDASDAPYDLARVVTDKYPAVEHPDILAVAAHYPELVGKTLGSGREARADELGSVHDLLDGRATATMHWSSFLRPAANPSRSSSSLERVMRSSFGSQS